MNQTLNTVSGEYFNTNNTITAAADEHILKETLGICDMFNRLLSKTIPGSDVWELNHADGATVAVSEHSAVLIDAAIRMHRASGGLYNISVGRAVGLWHFNEPEARRVPGKEELSEALEYTDISLIRQEGRFVTMPKGMQIDLGGIAKGYIADCIGRELKSRGVQHALINLGGNVLTIGTRPDGTPWQLGLEYPFPGNRNKDKYWCVITSSDNSVVTSGCYERGFYSGGKWYHHILDPHTGIPVENDVLSVTVRCPSSFVADAVTTPLFIMGPEKGIPFASQHGVEAVYYLKSNEIIMTGGTEISFVKS